MNKLENFLKYPFRNIFFLNIFPVIIFYLFIFLFGIIGANDKFPYILNKCVIVFNLFLQPLFLLVANMIHSNKYRKKHFILNIVLMLLSCFIGMYCYSYFISLFEPNIYRHHPEELIIFWLVAHIIVIFGVMEWIFLFRRHR